jgi:hypothetical protein
VVPTSPSPGFERIMAQLREEVLAYRMRQRLHL